MHAPLVSRWRHVQGGALRDAYTFADGVALFSCQSRMIRPSSVSIHALSLANGETVWQSAAVMKSRAPVYMRVMADGMVILASGTKVAVLKVRSLCCCSVFDCAECAECAECVLSVC